MIKKILNKIKELFSGKKVKNNEKILEYILQNPGRPTFIYKKITIGLKANLKNQKEFEKIITRNKYYVLFSVCDSVEWYTMLLKCVDFENIPKTYKKYYNGVENTAYCTKRRKENFHKAKLKS